MHGIVVHAVVRARISCPDQKFGIAIDQNHVAVVPELAGFSTCSDAEVRTFHEYAELAWATGGHVWNLDMIASGRGKQLSPDALQRVVDMLSDRILGQWPTGALHTDIAYWPKNPRPGDVITLDGTNSFSNQPNRQISNWHWDVDGDGTIDQTGPIIANIYSAPGRYRIVLTVVDDSNPPGTGRKALLLQVSK